MMELTKRIESRISIILTTAHIDDAINAYESIFGFVSKSKIDIECILFNNGSDQSVIKKIHASKNASELIAKDKLVLLNSDQRVSLSEVYLRSAKQATGVFTVFAYHPAQLNLNQITSWINANKKTIDSKSIYTESVLKESTNKDSFTNKWRRKIYNGLIRFFTPNYIVDYTSTALVMRTENAESLFDYDLATAKNHLEILSFASYADISIIEFQPNTEKKAPVPSFAKSLSVPSIGISIIWKWFVVNALHGMRKSKMGISNGNHPFYRISFCVTSLCLFFILPWLSFDFGVTWDSKLHNQYGYDMLKYFESDGKDTTCFTSHHDYPFYGEHINVISAYLNKNELTPWGEFETRHVLNSIYAFFIVFFCGLIAKEIGSWRTALMALIFITLTPVFLGNAMNNPTDIPLATGFCIATYYILRALKQMPKPKFSVLAGIGVGIGIAVGSRIAGVLIIAYFGLFLGILWLTEIRKNGFAKSLKLIWPYAKAILIASLIGYLIGISLWPYGQYRPIANPLQALTRSSDNAFFAYNVELFEGHRLFMLETPWYYVVKFMGITLPLYIIAGFVFSVLCAKWLVKKKDIGSYLMILFTIVFPLVYAEIKHINHYNAWRHYLFIYPAFVVLSVSGWDFLISAFKQNLLKIIPALVLILLMVKPTYWMIKNHPNEYVYFNEIVGGINGAYGSYETDYYSNSCRAAAEWLAHQEPNKKLLVAINNEPLTASYFANKINPNMQFMWVREYEEQRPMWDYLILTTRTYSQNELLNGSFPPKGTVYTVMADNVPLAAVVKRENYFMPLGYKAIDARNADSAIFYFTNAVQYDEKSEEANRMLGQSYLNKGSFDTAESYLDKAIQIFPENYSAWSNKGLIYLNKKEYDKAISYFKKAIHIKRNFTEGYFYAAMCELSKNNYEGAIPYLENALKNNGQVPEVYYNLGIAYLNTGRYNKAEEAFTGALTLSPKMASAYRALSETYTKLNKKAEADFCMQKYQELGGQ